jgi:hypothetical protein
MAARVAGGVVVNAGFSSNAEERWEEAYQARGGGDLESFRKANCALVEEESSGLGLFQSVPCYA